MKNERFRTFIHVSKGRIQAVTASGVDPEEIARQMPEALQELAPVVKFTVAGRRGSEVNGLVELLNNKVLDPRLLKKLLRIQSSILLRTCFLSNLKSFRFNQSQSLPSLFEKLPLDDSLLSLLVEGSLICEVSELPVIQEGTGFVRKAIRGQNLDRAGLSSRHMRLMSLVAEPITIQQMASQLEWPEEEVRRVVHGFELSELVESCSVNDTVKVYGVIADPELSNDLQNHFKSNPAVNGRVVRDLMGLRLLIRRSRPDVLMLEVVDENIVTFVNENLEALKDVRLIGCKTEECTINCDAFDIIMSHTFDAKQFSDALKVFQCVNDQNVNDQVVEPAPRVTEEECTTTGAGS